MEKHKEKAKYNVVSTRVSDEEKKVLEVIMRHKGKTIAGLMREAILQYAPQLKTEFRV